MNISVAMVITKAALFEQEAMSSSAWMIFFTRATIFDHQQRTTGVFRLAQEVVTDE
jgi:hypothetical protein